jgi:Zn-dependent protease with chaperone function
VLPLLAVIVVLAPGLHAWWTGRTLLARIEDPAFPELLLARMQRRGQIAAAAAVVSAFMPGSQWLWVFPLFVMGSLVGGFPFRRTLYGETWSVASYLRCTLFGFVGTAGFWLALGLTPFLILSLVDGWTPSAPIQGAVIVGALCAIVLVIWEYAFPVLWLALHRASPIQRAHLAPRFDDIIRRSTVSHRPPQVFRYGARGAYVMNAVALPSTREPRVAFGDSLLELLTPEEIGAVFAHEVAHLEHFDRSRMLRFRLITYLLILGATAVPPVLLAGAPAYAWSVELAWPIIVIALLALRASKSQAQETESDLRAGALTGDPEAMVRALTKLHHYSRMPRRWPYDFEQAASHPSLARRIQALRVQGSSAATAPSAQLGAPTVLRSTEPGAYAALDDTRAYWFDGVPTDATAESTAALREQATSYRAVAYADLTELRVAVRRGGGRALLARDRGGKTWSMPLRPDDVAAAQQALDVLDIRLGNQVRENWAMKARAGATLLALALIGALEFSWAWIPLLITLAKPSKASVAAMGSMVIGRVILGGAAGTLGVTALGPPWPAAWLSVVAMFGIGVWACRLAWRWTRGDERPTRQPLVIVTLAILSVLLVGARAIATNANWNVAALSLPTEGPTPTVAVVLLGVGAAFLTYRDNLRRRSGATLVVLALTLGGLGLEGRGLFARGSDPGIVWTTAQADAAGRVHLNDWAYRLHLSPGGQRFAVQGGARAARDVDNEDKEALGVWKFTIANMAGARRTTEALDLTFVDDDRVLVLRPARASEDSLELSVERAEGRDSVSSWRRTIRAYAAPALVLDRATGTWRVTGHDVRAGALVTSVGRIGSDSVKRTRASVGVLDGRPLYTYRDGTSLIVALHESSYGVRQMLAMRGYVPFGWDVWHVVNGERRNVGPLPGMPECGGRDEMLLCVAHGRTATTLWRVGASGSATRASPGALPSELDVWDIGTDGRVAASSRDGGTLAILDAGLKRGTRITLSDGVQLQGAPSGSVSYVVDVAIAPTVAATLVVRDKKSEVRLYRVK